MEPYLLECVVFLEADANQGGMPCRLAEEPTWEAKVVETHYGAACSKRVRCKTCCVHCKIFVPIQKHYPKKIISIFVVLWSIEQTIWVHHLLLPHSHFCNIIVLCVLFLTFLSCENCPRRCHLGLTRLIAHQHSTWTYPTFLIPLTNQ